MAFISWNDRIKVGIKEIDDQHKVLIDYINQLYDAMKARKGKEVLAPLTL